MECFLNLYSWQYECIGFSMQDLPAFKMFFEYFIGCESIRLYHGALCVSIHKGSFRLLMPRGRFFSKRRTRAARTKGNRPCATSTNSSSIMQSQPSLVTKQQKNWPPEILFPEDILQKDKREVCLFCSLLGKMQSALVGSWVRVHFMLILAPALWLYPKSDWVMTVKRFSSGI